MKSDPNLSLIVELLKFSLFGGPEPSTDEVADWDSLLKSSQREAVVALTYDALSQLSPANRPPKQVMFHWASITNNIEQSHQRNGTACADLQQLFSAAHPECGPRPLPVVKGLRLASVYPNPSHREFGDIDLYCGPWGSLLQSSMEQQHIDVDTTDRRHLTFDFHGAHFEAHHYLFYCEADNHLFSQLIQQHGGITNEMHALFVAAHIERHAVFFDEGMHLKDLCDWAILLKTIDHERFNIIKKGFEVEHFADLLTAHCCQLWGLSLPSSLAHPGEKTLNAFNRMFVLSKGRSRWALVRVARRSLKYLRHNDIYRSLYGQSIFRRFYFSNVTGATKQLLLGKERKVRH